MNRRGWIASSLLLTTVVGTGIGLAAWKLTALQKAGAAAASQPEPMESVTISVATPREHQPTTTSIGTVLAMRSVTLRNELPGTARKVALVPGEIVEEGTLLVALDVSVEEAELKALEAQAALAEASLRRVERLEKTRVAADADLDRARAERDVALAQIARTRAVMERKTIKAPFRARVGMADLHPGQYLNEGTQLTTLQSVDDSVHVDFAVAQWVAVNLRAGSAVEIIAGEKTLPATIVALDARIDSNTRNATVRAKIDDAASAPPPGASVRVRVPVGAPRSAVAVPVSAVRKGPEGDHVFVIAPDKEGKMRASVRPVQSGAMLGDEMLIERGINAGERVAALGSFKLRETVLVAVAEDMKTAPETRGSENANR